MTKKEKKDKELLLQSIAHWERMRDDAIKCDVKGERPFGRCCPLCQEYWDGYKLNCGECPIAEDGHSGCRDTPFWTAVRAWENFVWGRDFEFGEVNWKLAAQKEIDYLKSLLPK